MTPLLIWSLCLAIYLCFWVWYVGFKPKVTSAEVAQLKQLLDRDSHANKQQIDGICDFLSNDDGKDFVMVNLLELKNLRHDSRVKLLQYQKVFLGQLLKRAGHPVLIGQAAGSNIENIGCENDQWTGAGMIRYRSRRDLFDMLLVTVGSPHHQLKLDALARTAAFPAAPWTLVGGPKLVVPLTLALIAALSHLLLI